MAYSELVLFEMITSKEACFEYHGKKAERSDKIGINFDLYSKFFCVS